MQAQCPNFVFACAGLSSARNLTAAVGIPTELQGDQAAQFTAAGAAEDLQAGKSGIPTTAGRDIVEGAGPANTAQQSADAVPDPQVMQSATQLVIYGSGFTPPSSLCQFHLVEPHISICQCLLSASLLLHLSAHAAIPMWSAGACLPLLCEAAWHYTLSAHTGRQCKGHCDSFCYAIVCSCCSRACCKLIKCDTG